MRARVVALLAITDKNLLGPDGGSDEADRWCHVLAGQGTFNLGPSDFANKCYDEALAVPYNYEPVAATRGAMVPGALQDQLFELCVTNLSVN